MIINALPPDPDPYHPGIQGSSRIIDSPDLSDISNLLVI